MVNYFKLIGLGFSLLALASCKPDPPPDQPDYSTSKTNLDGLWQYDSIRLKGEVFLNATPEMLPVSSKSGNGGLRAELDRRRISYSKGFYQLIWLDRGDYQIGPDDSESWQPNGGFYLMNAEETKLWHNNGLDYEQVYDIQITGGHFTRSSMRTMAEDEVGLVGGSSNFWIAGEEVLYEEFFSKVSD